MSGGRERPRLIRMIRTIISFRAAMLALALVVGIRLVSPPVQSAARVVPSNNVVAAVPAQASDMLSKSFSSAEPKPVQIARSPELAKAVRTLRGDYQRRHAHPQQAPAADNARAGRHTGQQILDGLFGVGPVAPAFGYPKPFAKDITLNITKYLRSTLYPEVAKVMPEIFDLVAHGMQSGSHAEVEQTLQDVAGVLIEAYEVLTGSDLSAQVQSGGVVPGIGLCFFGIVFIVLIAVSVLAIAVVAALNEQIIIFFEIAVTKGAPAAQMARAGVPSALEFCKPCVMTPRESRLLRDRMIDRLTIYLSASRTS